MTVRLARVRSFVGLLALALLVALATPVAAQRVSGSDPTAQAVQERQLLQEFSKVTGRGTIPDTKSYVLEHPAGRDWRQFHETWLPWIGGIVIIGMVVLLAIYQLWHGTITIKEGRSGRTVLRFTAVERFLHWTVAVSFVVLALTGLNVTFGKHLLLPLMSPEAFTTWSEWAKHAHDFASFPFTIGVIILFVIWIAENFPTRADVQWVKQGGGMFDDSEPPAWRFNAGQKIIFWLVALGTIGVAVSGTFLLMPFAFTDISGMQTAQGVHGVIGMLFIALIIGHIYIGTLGMEGAFEGMGVGTVDYNWAKEHHRLWLEHELAGDRGAAPSPGVPPKAVPPAPAE